MHVHVHVHVRMQVLTDLQSLLSFQTWTRSWQLLQCQCPRFEVGRNCLLRNALTPSLTSSCANETLPTQQVRIFNEFYRFFTPLKTLEQFYTVDEFYTSLIFVRNWTKRSGPQRRELSKFRASKLHCSTSVQARASRRVVKETETEALTRPQKSWRLTLVLN